MCTDLADLQFDFCNKHTDKHSATDAFPILRNMKPQCTTQIALMVLATVADPRNKSLKVVQRRYAVFAPSIFVHGSEARLVA